MAMDTQHSYGALERGGFPPRPRAPGRDDAQHLFSDPVNAARLRQAIDDSLSGQNMIPVTLEDLEARLHRGQT